MVQKWLDEYGRFKTDIKKLWDALLRPTGRLVHRKPRYTRTTHAQHGYAVAPNRLKTTSVIALQLLGIILIMLALHARFDRDQRRRDDVAVIPRSCIARCNTYPAPLAS